MSISVNHWGAVEAQQFEHKQRRKVKQLEKAWGKKKHGGNGFLNILSSQHRELRNASVELPIHDTWRRVSLSSLL